MPEAQEEGQVEHGPSGKACPEPVSGLPEEAHPELKEACSEAAPHDNVHPDSRDPPLISPGARQFPNPFPRQGQCANPEAMKLWQSARLLPGKLPL